MRGHSPGSVFSHEAVAGLIAKYTALTGSLHHLSIQMDSKKFPSKSQREMAHRSAAISAAVKTLLDGKNDPPATGKNKPRGEIDLDAVHNHDEEDS